MAEEEKTYVQVGKIKVGGYILIDDFPCQIKSVEKSKPGKHGSTKARMVAIGVFDNVKRNLLKPTSADAEVPWIQRKKGVAVAVMAENVQIIDEKTFETFDAPKPKDLTVTQGHKVEYLQYGNMIKIVRSFKE